MDNRIPDMANKARKVPRFLSLHRFGYIPKAVAGCLFRCSIGTIFVVVISFFIFDHLFTLPITTTQYARVVVASDGTPLRAFADENSVWRYPVRVDEVSPNYIEALINYEDRWFYQHPGVNPFALLRALWQNLYSESRISGASTLTMQVARLLVPNKRSYWGKLTQIFRDFQLEWHYSKDEILTLYLNHAPFGGTIEGVQAATYTYLGKSAANLSDAEAALMAVLPQAPSRNRPDRHPDRAQTMRDKVLERLARQNVWDETRVADAKLEPVWAQFYKQPMRAPLLSRRLIKQNSHQTVFHTNLNSNLQIGIVDLVKNRIQAFPAGTSAAVLVMENHNLAVRAYIGSGDFTDAKRFGHVDMVRAIRSPGSTLKPFIYGMALDAGLIHSQSLLIDAPSDFGDYRPQNFAKSHLGAVSVTDALQRSLNIPAIQVLDKLGENYFMNRLKSVGVKLKLPKGGKANLALGLGGVGTTLESLVGVFSALANEGMAGKPRFLDTDRIWQRRVLSRGAAWIVRDILNNNGRPDRPAAYLMDYRQQRQVAWKTGTSYGYRDSWAIGASADYTVGVWVGRPDATPLPGYFGAIAAVPILFDITDHLPPIKRSNHQRLTFQNDMPDNVSKADICWPMGGLVSETPQAYCHLVKQAYLIDDNTPQTFPDSSDSWSTNPVSFMINAKTNLRVDSSCHVENTESRKVALWPKAVEPWIEPRYHRYQQIPDFDSSCNKPPVIVSGDIKIAGIHSGSILRQIGTSDVMPSVQLHALGGQGKHYWFINGELSYVLLASQTQKHDFEKSGSYRITVIDEQGREDEIFLEVLEK